ncbi:lipoyl(octanoyl) transferase LipB [Desulfobacterota bacterium AH_259_B03_O07]|nr:lipoyl(octanoyl) transferase LipB [Desulfobacterota bacterium AH_259_B03_O07]
MTRFREKLLEWIYMEDIDYISSLKLQVAIHERLSGINHNVNGFLLFVEHKPVITLGKFGNRKNIIESEKSLNRSGIEVYQTLRGGDVTFHGPGQLVGYPIINLRGFKLRVKSYVHLIEDTLISVLRRFGIEGKRNEKFPGVWVRREKIASIGLQIKKNTSMHGFALNVNNDLRCFSLIVPCGIRDMGVTSIRESIQREISLRKLASFVAGEFGTKLNAKIEYIRDLNDSSILSHESNTTITEKVLRVDL